MSSNRIINPSLEKIKKLSENIWKENENEKDLRDIFRRSFTIRSLRRGSNRISAPLEEENCYIKIATNLNGIDQNRSEVISFTLSQDNRLNCFPELLDADYEKYIWHIVEKVTPVSDFDKNLAEEVKKWSLSYEFPEDFSPSKSYYIKTVENDMINDLIKRLNKLYEICKIKVGDIRVENVGVKSKKLVIMDAGNSYVSD